MSSQTIDGPTPRDSPNRIGIFLETRYLCSHVVVEKWLNRNARVEPYFAGNLEILRIAVALASLWRKTQFFNSLIIPFPTGFKEFFV